ncbi:MAG TPA: PEGA domain-containing protein [Vicinamibacterales bacterium]|nr:PEGA domain-containing protein [Vicinamibacterales bacterium]
MAKVTGPPVPVPDNSPGRAPLSSWYTQGLSDGFGDRLLMFDNATTGPLELLRVRADFAFVPDFEGRIRARFDRLTGFAHPGFAQARAVNHLDNGEGLTVVSTHVPGTRLSDIFPAARPHAGMHPTMARWILGELTASLAVLHGQYPGVAHGALAPERIVITADRRVVITDYVFGDALEALHLPAERLWTEFRVVHAPRFGVVALDPRADVVQLALIGVALVVGRRITPDEYVRQPVRLLDEFAAACDRQMPGTAAGLRSWMEQALDEEGFISAVEADRALTRLTGASEIAEHSTRSWDTVGASEAVAVSPRARGPERAATVPAPPLRLEPGRPGEEAPGQPRLRLFYWVVAALAVIGVVQGAVIARLVFRTSPAASAPASSASAPGGTALVTGSAAAPSPVNRPVAPGGGVSPVAGAVIASSRAGAGSPDTDTVRDGPPPDRSGRLRITAPIELDVLEGARRIGSSSSPSLALAAGTHQLTLRNAELGVITAATARVEAGKLTALTVDVPDGTLSANAQPWAQVIIDGRAVGETPIANLSIAVGWHDVVFRHPQHGQRSQRVVVRAGTLSRVSVVFAP